MSNNDTIEIDVWLDGENEKTADVRNTGAKDLMDFMAERDPSFDWTKYKGEYYGEQIVLDEEEKLDEAKIFREIFDVDQDELEEFGALFEHRPIKIEADEEDVPIEVPVIQEPSIPRIRNYRFNLANVFCTFSLKCKLNLPYIAFKGQNVEYKPQQGLIIMRLPKPKATALIRASGFVTMQGASSEYEAKVAARRIARIVQRLGFNVRFQKFRVVFVLASCSIYRTINMIKVAQIYKKNVYYEPELSPGLTYTMDSPKATARIFSTGNFTLTASNEVNANLACNQIYDYVIEYSRPYTLNEHKEMQSRKRGY